MEFDPNNQIIKLCIQGMDMEGKKKPEEASKIFIQAWNEATNDFEKFITGYYVARHQKNVSDKLRWYETVLQHALKIDNDSVNSALPSLYLNIAKCYEESGKPEKAKKNSELATSLKNNLSDKGPFYHGTKADLQVGDLLTAGSKSNYKSDLIMNHIYFTALVNGAGLAAALSKGDGRERVYIVEPTGEFEDDPNVTNKKFPGNPTRSYRSELPLKIIGELESWESFDSEFIQQLKRRVETGTGEIIN